MVVAVPSRRFEALDALRGICALLVALYHLKSAGHVSGLAVIRNSWMFVDFFFVLSGFVIAASYGTKLREGFGAGRFMALRLGRVYPLHLFVLLIYVAFEFAKLALGDNALLRHLPWQSPRGPVELLHTLGLVHIFGLTGESGWNTPSWSIAAEVWTYLVFALILTWTGKWAGLVFPFIVLGAGLWLFALGYPFLDRTFSYALVRSLFGFSLGVLAFSIFRAAGPWARGRAATLLECGTLGLVAVFVALVDAQGAPGLLAPPLFALAVAVFAGEQGAASRLLTRPFPVLLGALSYSIYMIHVFVMARAIDVAIVVSELTGLPLASIGHDAAGRPAKVLGTEALPFMGDLMSIATLALVVGLSWITYSLIERPAREWVRLRVGARGRPLAAASAASGDAGSV